MSEESRFLKKWSKGAAALNGLLMSIYFWMGFITLFQSIVSLYSFLLSFFVSIVLGMILSGIRNRFATKYQESLTVKALKKLLRTLVIGFAVSIGLFSVLPYLGGSVSPWLIPAIMGLIMIIFPFFVFLDFHTDLGEAVFYFNHAIDDNLDVYLTKEGTKKLENYLKNQGISVSSRDLVFRLNIARMKNEDVTSILEELVNSLKNRDAGLYEILVKILEKPSMIKSVESSIWKNSFQLVLSDPKVMQLFLLIIWGIITLAIFILTGRLPQ